ncbi:KAT8 regulatory NSL complex subunit 1-like protein isoform X3 [Latimeria chalumnae]|uniref:KAT8 regulatory NSL complex subunit 1-like protein isoform X3 n=1 Tax=Latimeria chalumnae TaxID=7897 RepID=UPI00313B24CA
MAPALTEAKAEGHGVHLSSSLSSSAIEPDMTGLKKDPATEQKMIRDCDTSSAWSRLTHADVQHDDSVIIMDEDHGTIGSILTQSPINYKNVFLRGATSFINLLSLKRNIHKKKSIEKGPHKYKNNSSSGHCKYLNMLRDSSPETHLKNKSPTEASNWVKMSHSSQIGCLTDPSDLMDLNPKLKRRDSDVNAEDQISGPKQKETNGPFGEVTTMHATLKGFHLLKSGQQVLRRNQDPSLSFSMIGEEVKINCQLLQSLTKQQTLVSKAQKIQKRLRILQAKHVGYHCEQQIGGLVKHQLKKMKGFHNSGEVLLNSKNTVENKPSAFIEIKEETGEPDGQKATYEDWNNATVNSEFDEIKHFTLCAKSVLSNTEKSLDSDATGSSSDDDQDSEGIPERKTQILDHCSEWKWLTDRAQVGRRWTWLQAQISELENKIQQLTDIRRQIQATKGTVILEESVPQKDRLKQQRQSANTTALLNTAGNYQAPVETKPSSPECDLEMSPSSPTLLLKNIEKQSAQLTEIVNSLIPPLNFSPASSPNASKLGSCTGQAHDNPHSASRARKANSYIDIGSFDQRHVRKRRPDKAKLCLNNTCASARTRPVRTFQKRRLFRLCSACQLNQQDQQAIATVPCECGKLVSCRGGTSTVSSQEVRPETGKPEDLLAVLDPAFHSALSFPSDFPLCTHFQLLLQNEDWTKRPFMDTFIQSEESTVSLITCNTYKLCQRIQDLAPSSGCDYKDYQTESLKHWSDGFSPVHKVDTGPEVPKQPFVERKNKRHVSPTAAESNNLSEEFCVSQHAEPSLPVQSPPSVPSKENMTPGSTVLHKPSTQSSMRRRPRSESSYDIDNIVIPMSLIATSKVEKLQYKEIMTPSWRILNLQPLDILETDGEEPEDLSDEMFSSRHEKYEEREKARWFIWEQSRWQRRSSRLLNKRTDDHHLHTSLEKENYTMPTVSLCTATKASGSISSQQLPSTCLCADCLHTGLATAVENQNTTALHSGPPRFYH